MFRNCKIKQNGNVSSSSINNALVLYFNYIFDIFRRLIVMDDMDTGSVSASGSENRELSEEDVALSPPPMSEMVNMI